VTDAELRDLDAWIAEQVMGFKLNANGMIETWPREGVRHDLCVANYTTDPAAAMQVLEKCADEVHAYELQIVSPRNGGLWHISSGKRNTPRVNAETLPIAICRFAQQLFSK